MSRRDKRLNKKWARNVIIVAIVAVFLIVVYRYGFLTRTEPVVTALFSEQGTEKTPLTASLTINQDTDGRYYVLLPDKVQSYKISRFIKNNVIETEETKDLGEPEKNAPEASISSTTEELKSLTQSSQAFKSTSNQTSIDNELQDNNTLNDIDEQVIEETEFENENANAKTENSIAETNTISNIIANNTVEVINNIVEQNIVSNEVQNVITNETVNEVVVENIIDNNVIPENNVETQINSPISTMTELTTLNSELEESSTDYLPSSKYYLSEEEYNDKAISLGVVYITKTVIDGDETLTLYSQELENTIQSTGTTIIISGFIPYECSVECINMQSNVNTYIDGDNEYDEAEMLLAYDISIVGLNGVEYEPVNYSESVKVKIVSDTELGGKLDGRNVWLRHFVLRETINETTGELESSELVDEKVSIAYKKDNTIEFLTDEFSPYAVFSFNPVLEDSVTIDDYESDKNYYLGLNYTENGVGRTGDNIYKEGENLAEVTINYHGYDYTEAPVPADKYFQTATWTSTPPTEYYDSVGEIIGPDKGLKVQSSETGSGLNRYYNEIEISFNSNEDLNMTSAPWTLTINFQNTNNGFDARTTRTANSGINFSASGNTLTISGTNMNASGWTKSGNDYLLNITIYFRNEADRDYLTDNSDMLNPSFELGHNVLVGHKSTFTATIESTSIKLKTDADWTMSFDIPNSANFMEQWLDVLNTDVTFNHQVSDGSLILTGNSMASDGWIISGDTYTYSVTVLYLNEYAITTLPDNFMVRAITNPLTGRISSDANEKQFLMTYIKCVPIENGNVSIDLIDNPFMDRPAGLGFDGWTTHEEGYTFTINGNTFVQTLTTAVDPTTKKVNIKLYVDWKPATVIFVSSDGEDTNNYGFDINKPVKTLAQAKALLDGGNYKAASSASSRELNIIVLLKGEYTGFNDLNTTRNSKAFTLTSLYDGQDYRADARVIFRQSTVMYNDAQFDFLTITGSNYINNEGTSDIDYNLVGNTYNIRLGRGIVPYNGSRYTGTIAQVQGGPNDASTINRREYRLVIESGLYQNIQIGRASYYFTRSYTASGILVAGSDFDRVNKDNTKLRVYNRTSSRTCSNTITGYQGKASFTMIIKSGEFGRSYFNSRTGDYAYSGIYIGGHGYAVNDVGDRILIVEGGDIANIIGGLSTNRYNASTAKTFIRVKGGLVQNIVGGAGISTTYGDRIIQVTGGEVAYSVAGGSNGFLATDPNVTNNGHMDGNTLVYIGGNAEIGTAGTDNLLYSATAGSVFGAGLGTQDAYTSGQVFTSHVIIDGEAIIHNNVYGGGNYGIVGTHTSAEAYTLNIENSNLGGKTYFISTGNDTSSGSNILSANGEDVANGSYSTTQEPDPTVLWTFESVSGNTYRIKNGNGNYLEAYAYSQWGRTRYGLRLSNNPTTFTVEPSNAGVIIYSNLNGNKYIKYSNNLFNSQWTCDTSLMTLYLLKINEVAPGENDLDVATTVDILGGNINGSVFGGANDNGSVRNSRKIQGTTIVNVSGGNINQAVYGGCNTSGSVAGAAKVTVSGGTIGTTASNTDVVFGGGKGSETEISQRTVVNITDKDNDLNLYGSVYGGSALGSVNGTSDVIVQDISSEDNTITLTGDIYGGGKGEVGTAAKSLNDVTVIVDGGSFLNSKVFGGCNINGTITGDVLVKIGEANSTFVNEVYGGGNQANITNTTTSDNVYIYGNGTVNNVFNGGNQAGIEGTNERAVHIQGGTVLEGAYGGSNFSGTLEYTYVECLEGATAKNVYGGGKGNGTIISGNTEVLVKGASTITDSVYGGGEGETATVNGNTSVTINDNSTVNVNVYGGGNAGPTQGNTDVEVSLATIKGNVFGGGKGTTATVTTNSDVNVLTDAIIKGNIYGGGDAGSLTGNTDVYVNEATVNGNVFGGGKGTTAIVHGNTVTLIEGSQITNDSDSIDIGNVYGGGDQGKVNLVTTVSIINSTVKNYVYGGGNQADIGESTSVSLSGGATSKSVFGGGNAGEVGENTSVSIDVSTVTDNVYGGGNEGNVTGNTNVLVSNSSIANSIFGGGKAANVGSTIVSVMNTVATEDYTSKNVYGGGDQGEATGSTRVVVTNANIENEIYGGGNGAENQLGTAVPGKVAGNTYVKLEDATSSNVFGGGNGKTAIVSGNTEVVIEGSELIYSESDSITGHVFGGGNNGPVRGSTKVGLTNATVAKSAYAAGNGPTAIVSGNSYIYAEGTTIIGESIFGGGNAALTGDSTIPTPNTDDNHPDADRYVTAIVDISGAVIGQNVYGGANSSVIQGNTVVNIGLQAIDDFYNTEKGQSFTKGRNSFTKGKIDISGTIFGGGESMDPTKPFNYDTVSVLGTIDINVDGAGYDTSNDDTIQFHKSIFGSGNASRATGQTKTIHIKNYGTIDSPKQGVSLQRATDVIVDASALWLSGTTDSTSLHPDGYFTLNQITALKLKNNGTLYLRNGANRLASFYSLVDNPDTGEEEIATVNIVDKVIGSDGNTYYAKNGNIYNNAGTEIRYYIEDGKIIDNNTLLPVADVQEITYADRLERNVDNRIYIYSGINLNISDDEEANAKYGEVQGMTFFGLFRSNTDGSSEEGGDGSGGETTGAGTEFNETDASLYTGMFNHNYSVGGNLSWEDRNYNRSYVLGLHKNEHDILVDGFYTVYERFNTEVPDDVDITEENYNDYNPTTYISYITPTPPGDVYYMWYAGPDQDVYYYSLNFIATKHSTFGTNELTLKNVSFPNATLTMTSVEAGLIDGVGLYDKNTIPNINLDPDGANNNFGITMKSGNTGWSMVGNTDFYYNPGTGLSRYEGTEVYKIENSTTSPALSFYFYHSNNITEKRELGYFTIKMRLEYRKDAFNRGYADIIIDIALSTDTDQYMGYNGAITPGVQYDLFTTTPTNITTKSSFSTFFEFAQEDFYEQEKIQDYYEDSYRVLTTEYVYPVGTAITMIDRYDNNNPKYYYYVVTQSDVNARKNEYRLDEFKVMGSTDENYDEKRERKHYYIDSLGYEYENFIFITNFENAVFTDAPNSDGAITTQQHVRLYLKYDGEREEAEELVGLLDDQISALTYGIYESESTINIDANLSKSKIYLGNDVFLNVDTNYDVTIRGGSRIHDTRFFDKKLGTKLTFYYQNDEGEWDVVKGSELLGLYFELDGIKYYPSADGTTRIKIADLVSNATSAIKIGTENCSIDSNRYRIKVESFGSADGMYYGIEASDYAYVYLEIINDVFGLDVSIEPQQAVVDTSTGKVLEGNIENVGYIAAEEHKLNFTVDYLSGLSKPYITISLYRRKYDNVYDNNYEKVDLQDYVVETLETPLEADRTIYSTEEDAEYLDSIKQFEYEYKAFDTAKIASVVGDDNTNSVSFTDLELTLKDTLRTGTYKVEFKLYDTYPDVATNIIADESGNNIAKNYNITSYEYIGESFTYVIIK